ncbi:DNA-binding NarL/FixJ family response regulator [Azospirillum agricola]|uniref:response regulator n=1 Tax=Azospirillum agricola TaxID=1720247 RepID=UPI001AE57F5A|nr:response regulator transcription factor [Azospirillum agricola]MBP2232309.1 DNA-binding NarL/FixJ family response regulator [Azospirillum agricola]
MTATILLVDDHPIIRAGCRRLFGDAGLGRVVEAEDAGGALALWRSERPDIVVLDPDLPGPDGGMGVMRAMLAENAAARVLVFGGRGDPAVAAGALKAGAKGYVAKNSALDTLLSAVGQVLAGGIHLDHALARDLALMSLSPPPDPLAPLTLREREILGLLGRGLTAAAIADSLGISRKTVANACTQIKDKLGADGPRALVRIAIDAGLAG